jgi:hypothetical protein
LNAALAYVAAATGAGALGAIALLLLGTQILHWYWPLLLFAAGVAFGAWKLRHTRLAPYAVAQMLDVRLGLSDRLSTLVWFRNRPEAAADVLRTVEAQTASRVGDGDVERAVPIGVPKYAYASGTSCSTRWT